MGTKTYKFKFKHRALEVMGGTVVRCTADYVCTDLETGNSASVTIMCKDPSSLPHGFVPYEQLTAEDCCMWLEERLALEEPPIGFDTAIEFYQDHLSKMVDKLNSGPKPEQPKTGDKLPFME